MVSRIRWNDKEMLILNEIVTITKIGLKSLTTLQKETHN